MKNIPGIDDKRLIREAHMFESPQFTQESELSEPVWPILAKSG